MLKAEDRAMLGHWLAVDGVVVEGRVIGLIRYITTWGITYDLNEITCERRYCYQGYDDALTAMKAIVNYDDHPSGPWIKCKGAYKGEMVDLLNPDFGKEENHDPH